MSCCGAWFKERSHPDKIEPRSGESAAATEAPAKAPAPAKVPAPVKNVGVAPADAESAPFLVQDGVSAAESDDAPNADEAPRESTIAAPAGLTPRTPNRQPSRVVTVTPLETCELDTLHTLQAKFDALKAAHEPLAAENEALKGWIGGQGGNEFTDGRTLRFMQWNLQDLTTGGFAGAQGLLWPDRLQNIVNTILRYKPDVLAVQEVKNSRNGQQAFSQLLGKLAPHGYCGKVSGPVSTGCRGECAGLIWRKRVAASNAAANFILLTGPNAPEREDGAPADENTLAAAVERLGLDAKVTANCKVAFQDARGNIVQDFDRHLVLATLETNLGKRLHILIAHLDTKNPGNRAGVRVVQELASQAWNAGAWLVFMGDTNTHEAKNEATIWEEGSAADLFAKLGTRAIPDIFHTNMYPFTAGIKEAGVAKPKRNDEIFLPKSWEIVDGSDRTADVCPAALTVWARKAARLYAESKKVNQQLTHRLSDHLACLVDVTLPDYRALAEKLAISTSRGAHHEGELELCDTAIDSTFPWLKQS